MRICYAVVYIAFPTSYTHFYSVFERMFCARRLNGKGWKDRVQISGFRLVHCSVDSNSAPHSQKGIG
jgi:hypothetical protein